MTIRVGIFGRMTVNLSIPYDVPDCNVTTLRRSTAAISFDFIHCGIPDQCIVQLQDQGVLFEPSAIFRRRIDYITVQALRVLGFIRRHLLNFRSPSFLPALEYPNIRSVFYRGAIVWPPYLAVDVCRIQRVQNRFTSFVSKSHTQNTTTVLNAKLLN